MFDRQVHFLFDVSASLTVSEALMRGAIYHTRPNRAHLITRGMVRSCILSGIVEFDERAAQPTVRLVHPGVTYLPHAG
jgi:hypothetical protein